MSGKLRESRAWKAAKGLGGALVAIVGLWSGGITIAEKNAAPLGGFAAWTADNSWWMFPLSMLALGLIAGWNAKRYLMARENVTAERIAELKRRLAPYEDRDARIAQAIEDCGTYGLAKLRYAYFMKRAFAAEDIPGPRPRDVAVYLARLGLLERDPESGLWFMPLEVSRHIGASAGLLDRMTEAWRDTLHAEEMEREVGLREMAQEDVEALESGPFWQKVMLACLREKGKVFILHDKDMDPGALDKFKGRCSEPMARLVKLVSVGVSGTKVMLSEEGVEAAYSLSGFMDGIDWRYFIAGDEEPAEEEGEDSITVTCDDMSWLVNVDL